MKNFDQKLSKLNFSNQHSQPLYDFLQDEIENLELIQLLNF